MPDADLDHDAHVAVVVPDEMLLLVAFLEATQASPSWRIGSAQAM